MHVRIYICMSYCPTLRTALCCKVSSLNSFQELVIGEKSFEGTPENNLFIPVKNSSVAVEILCQWNFTNFRKIGSEISRKFQLHSGQKNISKYHSHPIKNIRKV